MASKHLMLSFLMMTNRRTAIIADQTTRLPIRHKTEYLYPFVRKIWDEL